MDIGLYESFGENVTPDWMAARSWSGNQCMVPVRTPATLSKISEARKPSGVMSSTPIRVVNPLRHAGKSQLASGKGEDLFAEQPAKIETTATMLRLRQYIIEREYPAHMEKSQPTAWTSDCTPPR